MMSSTGAVPEKISAHPLGLATNIPRFDSTYTAQGNAAITANEIDYYRFRVQETGVYQVSASTPASNLDTVLGVFDITGKRLASNDDYNSSNRDSRTTAMFIRGVEYIFAVTNFTPARLAAATAGKCGGPTTSTRGSAATPRPPRSTWANSPRGGSRPD